jgi:deoxyribodipyrimidine photo-lyase
MTSLFIFTRDLRLEDNTGLIEALKNSDKVLPVFIFDANQITDSNSYKSNNCVQFMIECLDSLNDSLEEKGSRLFYFYSTDYEAIIRKIIKNSDKYEIASIYITKDYTPFAKKREHILEKICKDEELELFIIEDHMLTGFDKVKKDDGSYYVKFTPYYRRALKLDIENPKSNKYKNYVKKSYSIKGEFDGNIHKFYDENKNIFVRGGRYDGLKILKKIKNFTKYNTEREVPSLNGTTHLSAYIKFNVVSIREVYQHFKKLGKSNKLITQLYWRDFYMQIMHNFEVIRHQSNKYIKWENNPQWIKKWKEGNTGIPIVDAGMRQMNTIGWMHNRVRMITSNFLIKILRCDWMIGEKYFAQTLVDYDYSNNKGGWLWNCGGTKISGISFSLDSQPYFRVFNPWRQAENYDSECEYIKKWIPELKDVPNKDILKWGEMWENHKKTGYPKPIVEDIQEEFKKTLKLL